MAKFVSSDNLSRFLTKLKALFATPAQVSASIADAVKNLVTNDALAAKGYQTADQVEATVTGKGYQTAADVDATVTGKGYQTAQQVDAAITGKGYDTVTSVDKKVADAKNELQNSLGSAFVPKGSTAFADLPTDGRKIGDVWNVTDAFTTTDEFVEGAGGKYPAGSNVVLVNVTTGEGESATTTPKWDVLSGVTDLSNYVQTGDLQALTNEEIDAMFA